MSVVFTATSLAVALAVSGVSGLSAIWLCRNQKENEIEAVETCFANDDLLVKTLIEHGFRVEQNEQGIYVTTNAGSLHFFRKEESANFWVRPFDLKSEEELEAQAEEIMDEYLLNVQKVNYQMIKEHVEKRSDMQIESETIIEDDTILLTIQLDD